MVKLTLSPISAFTQSAITTINQNMDDIETALEKTLSRDGTTPNQMTADFDMNNNDILNVDNIDANNIILNGEVLIPGDVASTDAPTLLALIETVDGSGSGLDADTVDGQHASDFQPVDSDLTAIAALSTQAYGRSLLTLAAQVDLQDQTDAVIYVADRTALKALDTTKITSAYLKEAPREGLFVWKTGDFSSFITADTQEGIYVKANAIASTSGSWVRKYDGMAMARYFGAVGDGTTNDATAINAALTVATNVLLEQKVYAISSTINISTDGQSLSGPIGRPGGVFNAASTTGATLKWTGALGGTAVILGSQTAGVDMHGGGLFNVQIDGGGNVNFAILVQTIDNAAIEKVKIHNIRDNSSAAGLKLYSNVNAFSPINCVHNCSFRDITISTSASGFGIYIASQGTSGGQNTTNCIFDNIHVTHKNNSGFHFTAIDTSVCTRLATSRLTGGSGANFYFDGNAVSGKICEGNLFNLIHPYCADGTPLIYADGQYSRQNKAIITGVDTFAIPQRINGAELFFEYTGSGYSGVIATEAPFNRVPPLQFANYDSSDATFLDYYEENTWTPGLSFGGGTTGLTYTTQSGWYQRVGRTILLHFRITINAKGSSTGTALLTGLPVVSAAQFGGCFIDSYSGMSGLSGGIHGQTTNNAQTVALNTNSATASVALTDTAFAAGSAINGTIIYRVGS